MDLYSAGREVRLRIKIVVGLAALGAFFGALGGLWYICETRTSFNFPQLSMRQLFTLAKAAVDLGDGPILAWSAAGGAALLAVPALLLLRR